MNLEVIRPSEIASVPKLEELEKQYRRSRRKKLFLLAIPLWWIVGAIPVYLLDISWLWEALAGWCLMVVFVTGAYVLLKVPVASEVVHNYSREILPGLLKKLGVDNPQVSPHHNLQVKMFLDAGLFHYKYNIMLREDSIKGTVNNTGFGMHEIALQVTSGVKTQLQTNHFYGWFIIVNIAPVRGFHFITMRKRINSGESDDWHKQTLSHWENDKQLQKVSAGNKAFDEAFCLNTDHPESLFTFLSPALQEFLLHLAGTTKNSFAISIQRSSVYLLIGHEEPTFRKVPEGSFTSEINPELVEETKWFVELVRGIARLR